MSASSTLRRGMHRLSLLSGASAMKARFGRGMRILMFHGIDDEHPPEVFEAQLRYLTRHFAVVPLSSVIVWLETERVPVLAVE